MFNDNRIVFVDGEDVTEGCYLINQRQGYVLVQTADGPERIEGRVDVAYPRRSQRAPGEAAVGSDAAQADPVRDSQGADGDGS